MISSSLSTLAPATIDVITGGTMGSSHCVRLSDRIASKPISATRTDRRRDKSRNR